MIEYQLQIQLEPFDLDGNGTFNGDEITPELKKLLNAIASDTGRTYAPVTGFIISPIYSLACHYFIKKIAIPANKSAES